MTAFGIGAVAITSAASLAGFGTLDGVDPVVVRGSGGDNIVGSIAISADLTGTDDLLARRGRRRRRQPRRDQRVWNHDARIALSGPDGGLDPDYDPATFEQTWACREVTR